MTLHLLTVIANSFAPQMTTNLINRCRIFLVANIHEFNHSAYGHSDQFATNRLQKLITPLTKRKKITRSFPGAAQSANQLNNKTRLVSLVTSEPLAPKRKAPIRNATIGVLLTPLIYPGTQSAERCRDVAYPQNSRNTETDSETSRKTRAPHTQNHRIFYLARARPFNPGCTAL